MMYSADDGGYAKYYSLISLINDGEKDKVLKHLEDKEITPQCYARLLRKSRSQYMDFPVGKAAESGHVEILRALFARGFDPSERSNSDLRSPVHLAAYKGHVPVVEALITEYGVDIETKDDNYKTPLYWAVTGGHLNAVEVLLKLGANLQAVSGGRTVLHVAAIHGHPHICRYLVSEGIDVNTLATDGCSPLHYAAAFGHVAAVNVLLDMGADIDSQNDHKETPFYKSIRHLPVMKILHLRGANMEVTHVGNKNPLSCALKEGSYEVKRYLIVDANVRLDALKSFPENILARCNRETASLLYMAGYSPRTVDMSPQSRRIVQFDKSLPSFIRSTFSKLRTLQELCCFSIRKSLGPNLYRTVDSLPLPRGLLDFVRLKHIPEEHAILDSIFADIQDFFSSEASPLK